MFHTYILYSRSLDRYYTGHTNNLADRLRRHNSGFSKATRNGIPWDFVYSEDFDTRSAAAKREAEIKKMKSLRYIENLISKS